MSKTNQSVAIEDAESSDAVDGACLEARSLRKVYGNGPDAITVLDGIDLVLSPGEIVAVVGPSGAGKSTLLHLLAALDTPTSGTVYFEQKAIDSFRESELADYRNRSLVLYGSGITFWPILRRPKTWRCRC